MPKINGHKAAEQQKGQGAKVLRQRSKIEKAPLQQGTESTNRDFKDSHGNSDETRELLQTSPSTAA